MKVQIFLAACLVAAAFAAPIDNFVDPDCIEEDMVVEEPSQEIDADFALGLPDLRMDFGAPTGDDECVDEVEPTQPAAAPEQTEECEEPITTQEVPALAPTEAECVDDPIETTEAVPEAAPTTGAECEEEFTTPEAPEEMEAADECEEEGNEVVPELSMRIEPAEVVEDIKMYGEEHMIPEIEECEE